MIHYPTNRNIINARISDFKENPLSEMFFALYQHELAKKVNSTKNGKKTGQGVSRMMKYLEGVEFIPFEKTEKTEDEEEGGDKNITSDFSKGEDAEILHDISHKYEDYFGTFPKHPKYDKLVNDLSSKGQKEKAVVFVRRIPSVFEISKRVLEHYDKGMWENLKDEKLSKLSYEKLDRSSFQKYHSDTTIENNEEDEDLGEEEISNIPTSKVLDLFKILKGTKTDRTSATNFRLRFNHSKPNIFSLFFSPGSNYFDQPYTNLISHRFKVGSVNLENYYLSAFKYRSDLIDDKSVSKDLQTLLLPKQPLNKGGEERKTSIETLITIFWDVYLNDEAIDAKEKKQLKEIYKNFNYYEKESFSNFIEKGTVLASEGLIWMYATFSRIEIEAQNQIKFYQNFTNRIKKELKSQRLYIQIQESIRHFQTIYTKVFSINSNTDLVNESWDSFNNAQPIYPYNAGNSNQKVLRSFNTPFFPDVIVATSVLQEGVNLQYFCKTIYHYGMAWTPGDNEQRIGRIDRMFSKIERELNKDKNSNLEIYYPYLKDTIDEEHLAKFVRKKYKEEQLIDMGKSFKESSDFALEENNNDNWKQFLRSEPVTKTIEDPFPVSLDQFKGIKTPPIAIPDLSFEEIQQSIINAIKVLEDLNPEIYFIDKKNNPKIIIDPSLNNSRKQPVVIEFVFDPIGTGYFGESVYCIKMSTPIAPLTQLKIIKKEFYENPIIIENYSAGVKLCVDITQIGGSHWGIYMKYELPLFIKELNKNPLSDKEIQGAFSQLILSADILESELFERDLQLNELNLAIEKIDIINPYKLRKPKERNIDKSWNSDEEYIFKEEKLNKNLYHDILKQSLMENHSNLYVKTYMKNIWKYQVSYNKMDAFEEELNLLSKHLEVVVNGAEWNEQS